MFVESVFKRHKQVRNVPQGDVFMLGNIPHIRCNSLQVVDSSGRDHTKRYVFAVNLETGENKTLENCQEVAHVPSAKVII